MKTYIKPTMECRKAMVESLLETTSLPIVDGTVDGENALGKKNIWVEDEEE